MKKLLQINCTSNWGSTGKIAEQIGLCAKTHGWESYIAYGRETNLSKNRLIKVGSALDVYEHYAESCLMDNEGLASRCATRAFLKELDAVKPDVVHLHNIHNHFLNYELLFAYLAEKKIPVVWTQHDQWAITGHCMYTLDGCEKWKDGCIDCQMKRSDYPASFIIRSERNWKLKKKVLASLPELTIVPVSEWLADNMRQSHLKDRPIEVIHNGIDINVFKPQTMDVHKRYGIDEGKNIVLGVSSVWNKDKGLFDFIKLSKNPDFIVLLVGLKQEQVDMFNSSEYKDCNIVPVCRTQNQQELAMLYSMADVFVNPTYADMFPTVNLEALACGTPVITYKTGGSPEAVGGKTSNNSGKAVEKYETGAVVETGNLEALAATIQEFRDIGFKKNHSANCRRRAEECFDKDRCFGKYIKLYDRILK